MSNTDPIGTQGREAAKHDFEIAFDGGGADFRARLQSLATAKDNAEKALAALNLGHDAVAALDSAKKELRNASEARAEADKYAAATRADADPMRPRSAPRPMRCTPRRKARDMRRGR